ncbi:MAG: putative Na+/H+ antiporter [Azoarcus sp.]|jgi:uncharacterized membrane protein|nr:putative Na+/H+ antiporter [Azoarcus sp.]
MNPTTIEVIGTVLFAIAILHTFSVSFFVRLAGKHPLHAGLLHLFGEVEFVFGFWAVVLVIFIALLGINAPKGPTHAVTHYLNTRSYVEPMFVFAIMVVAASKPVLVFVTSAVRVIARLLPLSPPIAVYFTILSVVPLFSSFITEPAAMTLAALMSRDAFYRHGMSSRLMYASIGVLFVNVSIGGTLTSFAAPPVLMVARTWEWDSMFMLTHIGWRSALAVLINAVVVTWLFRRELAHYVVSADNERARVPAIITIPHLLLLGLIVLFAHDPPVFMGIMLIFMALTKAYSEYQEPLILREALMVGCFLAGLVTLGGQQSWWLQPLLSDMSADTVYYGATMLTAITDNAALTFLGSLVQDLSDEFKYALVTGAVTGGGLTVIANAPNPAGVSILHGYFKGGAVNPLGLLIAALPPTLVAILAFRAI